VIAVVGLVAAFFTALYMFRLVFLTFFGKPRFDEHEIHPHESPPVMTTPLILLAIPSLLIGVWSAGRRRGPLPPLPRAGLRGEERRRGEAEEHEDETASLYVLQDDPVDEVG
jgi:NADH:ubiquinone oxidoreductase subunit 5 (subunit L)/multisubunit Na+/H+ antiporter MnhA subunit